MAGGIAEWTREEEAKYEAYRLAQEVKMLQEVPVDDDSQKASGDKAKPGKSKSQKKGTPDKDDKCVLIFMTFCNLLFFFKNVCLLVCHNNFRHYWVA